MKKEKNFLVIPTIYLLVLFLITSLIYFTKKTLNNYEEIGFDNITYVSSGIFNRSIPIINIPDTIKSPVTDTNVKIARYFYEAESDLAKKEKSIVFYEDIYMPNTGIDYVGSNVFDVLAVYDGTVVDVLDDELLGKTVKIRHNSELISVYQGVNDIEVKKGDVVFTGQKIATSGKSKINKDLGESMHFEIYKDGVTINPEKCLEQKIGDI